MNKDIPPANNIKGKYRHYKGNEYEVLGVGTHTESGEKIVIYKALHEPFETWLRPYEMFFGIVKINNKTVPRFKKIEN